MKSFVSVGMPVFNGERFVAEAIESVLGQTHADLELVISDNASTDSTADICDSYRRHDCRIRYYRQSSNIGPAANFRFVMDARRGDYFMWAAHDDVRSPDYISRVLELLIRDPTAILAHSWQRLIETTDPDIAAGCWVSRGYPAGIRSRIVAERAEAFLSCKNYSAFYGLYRSELLSRIGAPLRRFNSDGEYLFRATLAGPILVYPEALFHFRLLNSGDTYCNWFDTRDDPQLADFHLYLGTIRRATLSPATKWRVFRALCRTQRPALTLRAEWLAGQLLQSTKRKADKAMGLLSIARQYPPFAARRMFWGALRRQLPFF